MNDRFFPHPIRIALPSHQTRVVRSAYEALECLRDWPASRCRHYRTAWRACRDALDGLVSAERASAALREAARAARLIVV